ncbi:MAG: alanine-zipper protein [Gammaproteobacteria bacterium]|nr:alanine-zipper protein [Gammaproteobacteria bacterium]
MKVTPSRVALVLMAGLIGMSGCATTSPTQLDEVMEMARQAQSDAVAAREAASAAARAAEEAKRTASAAQSAISSAQSAADYASSCCAANSEKLERMFRESMRK